MADMVEAVLAKAGHSISGIARTVADGIELCQLNHPDIAVIDVRLADGGVGTDIANFAGEAAGILYVTANPSAVLEGGARGNACLTKPYSFPDLLRSVDIVAEMIGTGSATPPYPKGFRILPTATIGH